MNACLSMCFYYYYSTDFGLIWYCWSAVKFPRLFLTSWLVYKTQMEPRQFYRSMVLTAAVMKSFVL
jgi:hypothetical protein